MLRADVVEHIAGQPGATVLHVVDPLPDGFEDIGARGDIEKALIGFGVLDDGFGLAFDGQYHWVPALFEVLMKSPERRRKVVSDWMSLVMSSMEYLAYLSIFPGATGSGNLSWGI